MDQKTIIWTKLIHLSTKNYIHTIPLTAYPRRSSRDISDIPPFYQNYLAMNNTADVTGGNPTAVYHQVQMLLIL
jgi:hypothetical protein